MYPFFEVKIQFVCNLLCDVYVNSSVPSTLSGWKAMHTNCEKSGEMKYRIGRIELLRQDRPTYRTDQSTTSCRLLGLGLVRAQVQVMVRVRYVSASRFDASDAAFRRTLKSRGPSPPIRVKGPS